MIFHGGEREWNTPAKLYDIVRIDHFIGMTKYYTIPAEDEDARNGKGKRIRE